VHDGLSWLALSVCRLSSFAGDDCCGLSIGPHLTDQNAAFSGRFDGCALGKELSRNSCRMSIRNL